jgi:hypothetical protein
MLHTIDIYNIYSVLDTLTIKENKIQYVQYTQASFGPGFAQQNYALKLGITAFLET